MKLSIFILLNIIIIGSVVNCATYINFTPHPKCDTDNQESGIGYSWETNTCIHLYDGSYYVSIDPNNKNSVNMLFFNNPNSNCGHGETNVSRSYEVGNCYQVAWYYDPAFYNVINYAVMSIVVDPGYVNPEGYRYTLYQGDDSDCQGNPLFSYYYTDGITFKNTLQTFTYNCEQGIPYEYVCTENVSCINTTTEFQCQKSDDGTNLYSTTC
ncbi:hypothetical protein ACTFIV_003344 [Dictyostelium citrinum]